MNQLAAVVLTGGASRRMGRDKAAIRWGGQTLAQRIVRTVSSRCAPVIVVRAPDQDIADLQAVIVDDREPGQGPLVALGQGLRAAGERGAARAFVCAVDMPLVCAALIDELATGSGRIVLAAAGGRDHYLAAIYDVGLCDTIDELTSAGERRLGALFERVGAQQISISDPTWVVNVNTEADLDALPPLP
ncbi:molybdenum cofactor guanylyltransferase [Mycobacteroides salmoniphilum]|uniref:Probable molybdenum cofactor guanylyltransferase n=1 Tax=Mycobacteroides salmoniphilum TaxID=404941 RepID=A0A4R8SBJ7_9MYCO|nr:molybdenum cofactor guanylyltransferase [Mycobacteroides salmoniphilum]TDZ91946.1 putative molybdenum cofactor guanylyltransferase [Mycobacteroides salmoniphilum]TEA07177.1 putative molybdenum cofactor guanylyltransferase [Mycobacteroides salmoniphilum]